MNKYFLTEDQLMIQELAKKFADEVVAATVTELDEKHEFPMAEVKQCAEMGFLGVCVPEEYGGAGLGLSLVWEIANLHGGSVWVEESSDKGTTIAVGLPTQQSTKP